jgi:cardiolipin synthase
VPDLPTTQSRADRIVTVPNLLSVLRLAGVPLFLYLLLGPRADGWAILVLAVGGFTDWLDGKLARLLGQYSRLGALLDPAVDRLYILAALVALGVRRGYRTYRVTYLGKGATFLLLYAFPLLLLGQGTGWFADLARPFGYGFAVWGTALYLYSGALYLAQFVLAMRRPALRPGAAGGTRDGD